MASTVPAKSQPLHNFDLPHLKWNKDGSSSGHHQRRRSIKSPSRRPNTSSPSPIRQSPLRDSVSATPPRLQSPLPDSSALSSRESPVHGDYLMKQSPIRGESSKPSPIRECVKQSLTGGDSERLPFLNRDAVRQFIRRDLVLDAEYLKNSKGSLIEYRRNHSKGSAFDSIRNEVYSSTSEQAKEKLEKKSKGKEVDEAGSKRSKILIKIPCKNNKLEEENPQEEPPNIDNNDGHDEIDEVQEDGKINNTIDEETKTWNLRPRKPLRKSQNAAGGAEKGTVSVMPEKNKAHSSLINANKLGEKEGNCSGGSEKKEKRKLSISVALSKEEIEEDIFILTGSKPARRPKKRAKNIQKQLDFVFPGLWLVSITPDSYKVSENSMKNAGCDLVVGILMHSCNAACYILRIFNAENAGCDSVDGTPIRIQCRCKCENTVNWLYDKAVNTRIEAGTFRRTLEQRSGALCFTTFIHVYR
ncbi:hypothetical protein Salat_2874800 [Sesamum alatum]|uniref:Uncharacterized protein n=1 Tax=Sesamum alatum TaxID=300844 RepID=A0AAE2CA36_9LAMI|nr:hypothetical protein Salat_2874800 [Sesamum alatum]